MTSEKEKLLQAHVQFELNRLQGDNLQTTLRQEISTVFAWLGRVKVNEAVTQAQIMAVIQRTVVDLPITDELLAFIRENVIVTFESLQEDQTSIEEVFPHALYDRAVDNIADLKVARQELIHQFVSSSVYSMLISNVLYNGIKSFVLTDNSLAKNVPGASSLIKLSQNALNGAAPRLENNIDRQLTTYINANIKETIRQSEEFMNKSLDDELIRKIGEEVWVANATQSMSTATRYVNARALDTIVDIVIDFWLHYRQTSLFQELVAGVVHSFFLHYGKKDVRSLLEHLGVTEELATAELCSAATPLLELAMADGELERLVRHRLDAFYSAFFAQQE